MAEKAKIELEYIVNSSPRILYPFLVEPNELSQWFADDVLFHDGIYEFVWDNESFRARLVSSKENKYVKFKCIDDEENVDDRKKIWDNSIGYLQSVVGG
jgi:uncharacterized protein YndB with AHSA1/START domain